MSKMLILPGNAAKAGKYPDKQGNYPAWDKGALHVAAAKEYARRKGYEPVLVEIGGWPQSETSPQANKAVELFLPDKAVTAFYGFSGGGYNVRHILDRLAKEKPGELYRIDLVVVLGAPQKAGKSAYEKEKYNEILEKHNKHLKKGDTPANPAKWVVEYRENPPPDHPVVPKGLDSHMFGPEWLLWDTPATGKYRDWPFDDDD